MNRTVFKVLVIVCLISFSLAASSNSTSGTNSTSTNSTNSTNNSTSNSTNNCTGVNCTNTTNTTNQTSCNYQRCFDLSGFACCSANFSCISNASQCKVCSDNNTCSSSAIMTNPNASAACNETTGTGNCTVVATSSGDDGLSPGLLAVVIVIPVLVFLLFAALIFYLCKRPAKGQAAAAAKPPTIVQHPIPVEPSQPVPDMALAAAAPGYQPSGFQPGGYLPGREPIGYVSPHHAPPQIGNLSPHARSPNRVPPQIILSPHMRPANGGVAGGPAMEMTAPAPPSQV